MTNAAPNAAPLDAPTTKGSASGLRKRAWYAAPAAPRATPIRAASRARGRRSSTRIVRVIGSAPDRPTSTSTTSAGESRVAPSPSDATVAATSRPARPANAKADRRGRSPAGTPISGGIAENSGSLIALHDLAAGPCDQGGERGDR